MADHPDALVADPAEDRIRRLNRAGAVAGWRGEFGRRCGRQFDRGFDP